VAEVSPDTTEERSVGSTVWSGFKRFALADRTARWTARIILIGLWQWSGALGSVRIPTPLGTLRFIAEEWSEPYGSPRAPWHWFHNELVRNIFESIRRTGIALAILIVLGILIGFAMGRWWRVQAFFTDMVVVGLTLPGLIWALLAVMWFGFGIQAPVFVAVILPLPGLIVNVLQGSLAVPRELRDMSDSYDVPFRTQFRHLMMPSMAGHVMAGIRLSIIGGWGGVMLVEWFGNNIGAGYRARYWYDATRFDGLMAWGIIILAIIITIDRGVLERLDQAIHRYRAGIRGFGKSAAKAAAPKVG
jgi:NitT/TauT family transport system permease protein